MLTDADLWEVFALEEEAEEPEPLYGAPWGLADAEGEEEP